MKRILIAVGSLSLLTAACGGGNDSPALKSPTTTASMGMNESTTMNGSAATKTVDLTMVDIAYQPTTLSVQRGERVQFVFHNQGAVRHDGFIGDAAAQTDHEREMREAEGGDKMASDKMAGGDMNAITVEPGKTGQLTYTFDKAGTIEIACHEPGHYAAGMKIAVTVA
jgi:uncharacterized cupredoxin-like copper-binding protein